MAALVAADVSVRMSAATYLKLFDLDGVGTVSATFLAACLADGESEVNMRLYAAFGEQTLAGASGTVDAAIKRAMVVYAIRCALMLNPLTGDEDAAPFAKAFKWADDFFDRLTKDVKNRPVTSGIGRSKPRAEVINTEDAAGVSTAPLRRSADRQDPTGY